MTDRAFQLLGLFSLEQPVWTAEQIAPRLGVAISSAYRLIGRLSNAGLVDAVTPGRYVLGPAIIQLDRQIQLTDPLILAARPVMDYLIGFGPSMQKAMAMDLHIEYYMEKLCRGAGLSGMDLAYYSPKELRDAFEGLVTAPMNFEWRGAELFWGQKPS